MEMPHTELLAPHHDPGQQQAIAQGRTLALGGDEITPERIAAASDVRFLWTSRLAAAATETVGSLTGLERLVVHDYRSPDLQPLAGLRTLRRVAIVGSSKLQALSGLERLVGLEELILLDNCNYRDLAPLAALVNLQTLCLEGGFSRPVEVETLAPLAGLERLQRLRLAAIKVRDRSLSPLHHLSGLRSVFIARTFAKSELVALARALPEAAGEFLDSHR